LRYRRAVFDYRVDSEIDVGAAEADSASVLLFDGVFLHRPELRECWDVSIFLEAPFEVTARRLADRAADGAGDGWQDRYVEGQKIYLRECDPAACADIIVDYRDLASPVVVGG
jgi:uridine kinase